MDCRKKIKRFRKYKNKILCFNCYVKKMTIIGGIGKCYSMEKALSKIYTIHGYVNNRGRIFAQRDFPRILIGHKVKLKLIE